MKVKVVEKKIYILFYMFYYCLTFVYHDGVFMNPFNNLEFN